MKSVDDTLHRHIPQSQTETENPHSAAHKRSNKYKLAPGPQAEWRTSRTSPPNFNPWDEGGASEQNPADYGGAGSYLNAVARETPPVFLNQSWKIWTLRDQKELPVGSFEQKIFPVLRFTRGFCLMLRGWCKHLCPDPEQPPGVALVTDSPGALVATPTWKWKGQASSRNSGLWPRSE